MDQPEELVPHDRPVPGLPDDLTPDQRLAIELFGGMAGALIGLGAGAVVGAAAAPLIAAGLRTVVGRFREFGDRVTAESEMSLGEIRNHVLKDERLQYLFELAGLAAIRSPMVEKRQALARVLAAALGDEARVDEAQILVPVIGDLEAPHVQVLRLLEGSRANRNPEPGEEDIVGARSGEDLCGEWAPLAEVYEPVMATLRRHVLIETNEIGAFELDNEIHWVLAEFGYRVLGFIRQ